MLIDAKHTQTASERQIKDTIDDGPNKTGQSALLRVRTLLCLMARSVVSTDELSSILGVALDSLKLLGQVAVEEASLESFGVRAWPGVSGGCD